MITKMKKFEASLKAFENCHGLYAGDINLNFFFFFFAFFSTLLNTVVLSKISLRVFYFSLAISLSSFPIRLINRF